MMIIQNTNQIAPITVGKQNQHSRYGFSFLRAVFILIAFLTTVYSPLAFAGDADALARTDNANRAFDDGDFQAALVDYQYAHHVTKDPHLLYRIALTYENLSTPRLAREHYEAFLAAEPMSARAAKVEEKIQRLNESEALARTPFNPHVDTLPRGGRIALEAVTGLATGLLLTAGTIELGKATNSDGATALGVVSTIGLTAGSVWGAGELSGGDGSYLATLSGTLVGILAGFGVGILSYGGNPRARTTVAFTMPIIGAVMGYEISQSKSTEVAPIHAFEPQAKKRRLTWRVAPTSDGGTVQLGKRF